MKQILKTLVGAFAISLGGLAGALGAAQAQDVSEAARAALPAQIRDAGKLTFATLFAYPPFMFQNDAGELQGLDVELARAVATKLGLTAEFNDLQFPTILPAIETGRYDVAVGQLGITRERLQKFDYVPYFKVQFSFIVPADTVEFNLNDLCGHTIAAAQGSAQVTMLDQMSAACQSAGKPEITQQMYPDGAQALLAVGNKRAEGYLDALASGAWAVKDSDKLKLMPGTLDNVEAYVGYVVKKGSTDLEKAMGMALQELIADGTYQAILDKYGAGPSAITADTVATNPADLAKI